jgi:glycosyltransferase involved in cell wall biosynthesis
MKPQDLRWLRHYLRAWLIGGVRHLLNRPRQRDELLFVVQETARGWIMETICKNLCAHYPGPSRLHYPAYRYEPLPAASAYFFVHQNEAIGWLARDPNLWRGRRLVQYTHPSHESVLVRPAEIVYALSHLSRVLTMNARARDALVATGVSADRVVPLVGASDPERFRPSPRPGTGVVGLSAAYYSRKNPDLMAALVRAMPDLHFILIGKDWEQWDGFPALLREPNFEYLVIPYADYPAAYARLDVFLSTSLLEGGPIPLIEAMMCNRVPVVSDTGFAPDIIRHGENGYLFPVDATAEQVAPLIRAALKNPNDIAATTANLSWAAMARELYNQVQQCRP